MNKLVKSKVYRKVYKISSGKTKARPIKKLEAKIVDAIISSAGEGAAKLAGLMTEQRNVSEFEIARSTRLDIQTVRNTLYKLHSSNLADYKRVKDNTEGIYISYWTFNKATAKELFVKLQKEKLQRFRERLEAETSNVNCYFICPSACTRADFTMAEQQRFRCEECGKLMMQDDNTRTIDFLREKVREMEAVA
ncbi:hypothetical protein HYY73_00660 [Candidatus Woesearchaeota archaeon]|nr:hypothetical protein [Candidatus Woesearchaeota archaeon]